jgi:hypothetical protein
MGFSLPRAAHGHRRRHWQGPSTTQLLIAEGARAWTLAIEATESPAFSCFAGLATADFCLIT